MLHRRERTALKDSTNKLLDIRIRIRSGYMFVASFSATMSPYP